MMAANAESSARRRIAECMQQLVRGQQLAKYGSVKDFSPTLDVLQELISIALENDRNKQEIFMRDGLKAITAALDSSHGAQINASAADLIGLMAEANDEQARRCASFKHEGISVVETLRIRSQSKNMRVRTSARAALYSMHITPQMNEQVVKSHPPLGRRVTAPAGNLVPRGITPRSVVQRKIFQGDLAEDIFRSLSFELGQEWHSMATHLNVPYQSIAKLQTDAPMNTSQQCFQMLCEHWFNRQCDRLNDEQIKSRLTQALQHRTVGRNDLADRLDFIILEAKQKKELQQ